MKSTPLFLTVEEVIDIHRDQIERYGGSFGIRDAGLLKSAATMPAAQFGEGYLHSDLFEMAAAYLFHIIKNHPFIDGNKRTGAAASVVFLIMNGIDLGADEDTFEAMVRAVAEGKADKSEVAEFFRKHGKP